MNETSVSFTYYRWRRRTIHMWETHTIHIFNQIERSKCCIKQGNVWKYKLINCDSLKKENGEQTDGYN